MGLMSRNKGKKFERDIANVFREKFPDVVVRRSSQAERAYQSDIFVDSGPDQLKRLWLELNDAREPDPEGKLEQAELDVSRLPKSELVKRLPLVIWHKYREQRIWVTCKLSVLTEMMGNKVRKGSLDIVLTFDLDDLIEVLTGALPARPTADTIVPVSEDLGPPV